MINYVRGELDVEYAIVHPQLCVDDGDRFIRDYIKPGVKYVIGACDPKMQRKMFKGAFSNAGGNYDEQVIPLDLRNIISTMLIGCITFPIGEELKEMLCKVCTAFRKEV